MWNSYLRVHDLPDATRHTRLFPTQHTENHERKEHGVGDDRGKDGDPNIHYVVNLTKGINAPDVGYGYV